MNPIYLKLMFHFWSLFPVGETSLCRYEQFVFLKLWKSFLLLWFICTSLYLRVAVSRYPCFHKCPPRAFHLTGLMQRLIIRGKVENNLCKDAPSSGVWIEEAEEEIFMLLFTTYCPLWFQFRAELSIILFQNMPWHKGPSSWEFGMCN